jgi:hypothetical protein
MGDKRYYKTYHYINGKWEEDLQDPPKDYDLAIFVYRKSEADILKNKVSDSIVKNINNNNTRPVFEDYNNYKYISLNILYNYYIFYIKDNTSNNLHIKNKLLSRIVSFEGKPDLIIDNMNIPSFIELNTELITPKISNIAIVIFEKELYVFADDKLIHWIKRVVDMFKQDVDKFKQEKRILGSIFIYYFLFASMSDLISMRLRLYETIYYYSKKSRIVTRRQIPTSWDQKIEFSILNDLTEMKDLILELRIYLTYIKEVLREIQPLFRETSEYYNKLSDIKEECDDELYKIEQNMQSTVSTMFLFTNFRLTNVLIIIAIFSLIYVFLNTLLQFQDQLISILSSIFDILLTLFDILLNLIVIIVITIINLFYNQ